jgi:hypothetical protein
MTATDLTQREAERQALLDWIRSGANRSAYERDNHAVADPVLVSLITPELLIREPSATNASAVPHVRIRTLINERCLSCHNDDGDDTARLIPFDTYDSIARYLIPDDHTARARVWLLAAILSLFPLAIFAAPAFALTSHPLAARKTLLAITITALTILTASWLLGSLFVPLLLLAAFFAVISVMVEILATVAEFLGIQPQTRPQRWFGHHREAMVVAEQSTVRYAGNH